jgi:hypothetical protein
MRVNSSRGDEALKEVIEDPSGDAKGWFVIIRDGPLTHDVSSLAKPTGEVYVLWRKTRELAIEQLKLHQEQVAQGYGAPLRELHPTVFDGECNMGQYENGSFLLINADRDEYESRIFSLERKLREAENQNMPVPRELLKNVGGHTHTDPYTCPGCLMDKYETAEVILGDGMFWCSLECFRKQPPKGWITPETQGLILERNGAEKAEELLEEKIEELKDHLCIAEQRVLDLEDEVNDAHLDQEYLMDDIREEFEDARGALVEEIDKLKIQRTILRTRVAELELIAENNFPTIPVSIQENNMTDRPLENSHHDLPTIEELMNKSVNKQVQKALKKVTGSTCGICNKVLKGPQGVESHQRSTSCGVVLAKAIAADQAKARLQPAGLFACAIPQPKTEAAQLADIAYKRDVMKFHVIQTGIRWVTSAGAATACFIAYHIV